MRLFYALLILILLTCLLWQCQSESASTVDEVFSITDLSLPVGPSGMPNLFVDQNQQVYLSWLSFLNDSTDALQFSKLVEGKWTAPKTIASGEDWFANWADFPSLVVDNNGQNMVAHFLQYSASGTYDYAIKMKRSTDGGNNWSEAIQLHEDSVHAEHGFVSLLSIEGQKVFATWLDGRFTKMVQPADKADDDHGHGGGPMTLRTATMNQDGSISPEVELDLRVCDCCQTNAAMGPQGPIIVYRDRSLTEVRDIYIVRQLKTGWTLPKVIHEDNWKIAGCPVNGPAIAAVNNKVAVAWFTMAQEIPKVMLALSNDGGATFDKVLRIDEGNPLGRVDLTFAHDNESILLSWIENEVDKGQAHICLRSINKNGALGKTQKIKAVANSRKSGFPILKKFEQGFILASTKVEEKGDQTATVIETSWIR